MAPTRMKLRLRRRGGPAGEVGVAAGGEEGGQGGGGQPEQDERSRASGTRSRRKKLSNTSTATSSSSSSAAANAARPPLAADEASPDSKCPICLDRFNNLAYLDRCLHRFCFPCIQEWSHNKPECPLCKQPFTSILHSVRAEDDFKEYTLRPAPDNGSLVDHLAIIVRRQLMAETTRRQWGERGGRGGTGRRAGRDRYPDSPLHHQDVSPEDSDEGDEDQRVLAGAHVAERGVIFEGLTGLGGVVDPVAPNDRSSRRQMTRLATRHRLQQAGGTVRRLRERETLAFRRALYRSSIRVRGVAGVSASGNQEQQEQRDVTAETFRRNPASLNRLRPWLRRELTVLYGSHGSLVDIVQRVIMACLARHGLEDMHSITRPLRPYLLACTDHFLHELVSFARSPLTLEDYDLQAVYEPPAAELEHDGMISSNDGDSVIAISEDEEERPPARRSDEAQDAAHADDIQSGRSLSLAAWDDETPGPSYSTIEPPCMLAPLSLSSATQEEEQRREEEEEEVEECLIVGYKKPIAERTPELVQLSSNTEEEEDEKKDNMTERLPLLPAVAPPLSYPPTIPPSTSGEYRDDSHRKEESVTGQRCRSRARSWSASSSQSGSAHVSVCTLSPVSPRDGDRQHGKESVPDARHPGAETVNEKRRRKKRKRGRNRERVGILHNPNRSIYPAMMRRSDYAHSSSPFNSSIESCSPLPPSPPDSTWEYRCSHVSPPSSSCYSPSRSSSSSPLWSSPRQQKAPMASLSPSDCSNSHHSEKPGGKRKYKSRHLDSDEKDPTWRPCGSREKRKEGGGERKRRARRKERRRKDARKGSGNYGEDSRKCRDERSPSVEIIYEGTTASDAPRPPAHKRRRKRRYRRTQRSSSPLVITLNSDSSHEDVNISSSSPLSSQQTVDFSDLPPLPLVPSAGVGGALDVAVGALPVDILDRGCEPAARSEATDPLTVDDSGSSEREVDVENVEGCGHLRGRDAAVSCDVIRKVTAGQSAAPRDLSAMLDQENQIHKRDSEVMNSDSRLLATILSDLEGITAPKCDLPLTFDPSCSPESRIKRFRNQCDVVWHRPKPDGGSAHVPEDQVSPDRVRLYTRRLDLAPPLQHLTDGSEVPPLLKQASPGLPHNRNTPPPLKHKDAESPCLSPPTDTADSVTPPTNAASRPALSLVDSRLIEVSDGNQAVLAASISTKSTISSGPGPPTGFKGGATSHNTPPTDDCLLHLDITSCPSSHCGSNKVLTDGAAGPSTDPGTSLFSIGSRSARSPTHKDSRKQTWSRASCRVVPVDLAPDIPARLPALSGSVRPKASSPVLVSFVSSTVPSPASPTHSHFSTDKLSQRCLSSSAGSGQTSSFSSPLLPVDLHHGTTKSLVGVREKPAGSSSQSQTTAGPSPPGTGPPSPKCPNDLNRWSAAPEARRDGESSSVVGPEAGSPLDHLPHCANPPAIVVGFERFNHTALSSASIQHSGSLHTESGSRFESCSRRHHANDCDPKPTRVFDVPPQPLTDSESGVPLKSNLKSSQRDVPLRSDGHMTSLTSDPSGSQRSANSSDPEPQTHC